jgi:hypothetical protein
LGRTATYELRVSKKATYETILIRGLPLGLTWMRVKTTYGPLGPAVWSYVFPIELSLPGLLACFFSGPVQPMLLANPAPSVNLEAI